MLTIYISLFRKRTFYREDLTDTRGEFWALARRYLRAPVLTFINSIFSPDSLKEAGVKRKVTLFKSRPLSPLSGRSREIPQNSIRDSHVHIFTTLLHQLHPFSPVVHIIQCRSSHVYTHRQHMDGTDRQIDRCTVGINRKSERNRAEQWGKGVEATCERKKIKERPRVEENKRKRQIE